MNFDPQFNAKWKMPGILPRISNSWVKLQQVLRKVVQHQTTKTFLWSLLAGRRFSFLRVWLRESLSFVSKLSVKKVTQHSTSQKQQTKLRRWISYPDCKADTITIYTTFGNRRSVLYVRLSQPVILLQQSLTIGKTIEAR